MKTLTIGFSKSKKKFAIGSVVIRWYLKTKYSHTYFKFNSNKYNLDLIYEAVGSGVRFIGTKLWKNHAIQVCSYDVSISEEGFTKVMQIFIDNAGADYGYKQNLGIIIADIFDLKTNPFPSKTNCSELVARVLVKEGYEFDKDLNLVTPKDIELSILKKQYES